MPDQPTPLTPDQVNAIVRDMDDPRYPSRITVYCDHCGLTATGEYMVSTEMNSRERLDVARRHLVANEGWQHDADTGDDFCPTHAEPWWLAAASIAVVLVLLGRVGVGLIGTALNRRR